MKAPFLIERLLESYAEKRRKRGQRHLLRKFWRNWVSIESPYAIVTWIVGIALLATVGVFGGEKLGILEFGAQEPEIRQAYQEVLHREPDADGLKHYLDSDMSIDSIKEDLNNSAEKKALGQ